MAMIKSVIKGNLKTFLLSLQDNPTEETKSKIDKYCDGFSDWLIESVSSATVTVEPGIPVSTAGSPTAQTGATTSPGSGTIS